MGKPRMIIVIRHAQSEGNQNRQIHQTVPDHRVKLTSEGWKQAHDAGSRLRAMLHPSDTLQIYTSPYRRTRETTEGIIDSLTSDTPEPSPFTRGSIKVWEEPRLREQDFGNFQPCSAAMERMWQERADYGHFFFRIPNGESAADAYDRVSGFNESLWRSFGEEDFPSVCVLVTHGLMTRVFLMKWYHWSVEYFEDLRNVNHCEFVTMMKSPGSGKYILENQLRTWSEYKRRSAAERGDRDPKDVVSPPVRKRWGGCPDGCNHASDDYPRRAKRRDTQSASISGPSTASPEATTKLPSQPEHIPKAAEEDDEAFPQQKTDHRDFRSTGWQMTDGLSKSGKDGHALKRIPTYLAAGRDFGGSASGAATPDDELDRQDLLANPETAADRMDHSTELSDEQELKWVQESGMGAGARADALGDQEGTDDGDFDDEHSARQIEDLEKQDKSFGGSVY